MTVEYNGIRTLRSNVLYAFCVTRLNASYFFIFAVYYYCFSLVNMLPNGQNPMTVLVKSHQCHTSSSQCCLFQYILCIEIDISACPNHTCLKTDDQRSCSLMPHVSFTSVTYKFHQIRFPCILAYILHRFSDIGMYPEKRGNYDVRCLILEYTQRKGATMMSAV